MLRFWRNISVTKKLYGVVGVMALLIATELVTLYFAMTTLSAVRAFVGGEGLWSKAQKTAIYHLHNYASTGDEKYYLLFQDELKVPMGDHRARMALEQPVLDEKAVTEGFLAGKNHPQDIKPMVKLMRRFHSVPVLANAIEKWKSGDALMIQLMDLADQLRAEIRKGKVRDDGKVISILNEIYYLDIDLTKIENDFSFALGEASRWLENMLMIILLLAVVTVESTGVILTISFGRSLKRVLNELNTTTELVGKGDFTRRVQVNSKDELGQLAESINRMTANLQRQAKEKENAEHASETKNLFLANMSHEIRTPLNAILGFSEILSEPNLSEEQRKHYSAIIKRTGATLTSIIKDILDLSKVEAEQIEVQMKPFSLAQMIADLDAVLRLRCEEKGIGLHFQQKGAVAGFIQSDPARLRQILINIIGNAIKFTDRGSVTTTYQVEGQNLIFEVRDTGAGISPEQVSRLFKPFSQGDDSVKKKYGGTGLGLLISQRLAQLLGGDVELLESKPGQGSAFRISIAYAPVEKMPSDAAGVQKLGTMFGEERLKDKKILVVEDSLDNQLLVDLYLGRSGARVEFAGNGQEGIEKVQQGLFDLVLMDIQMPIMDGYTATKELRKQGYDLPIIALTGYAMKEDQSKCIQAGCSDYVSKPIDRNALVQCVSRYL